MSVKKKINFIVDEKSTGSLDMAGILSDQFGENFSNDINLVIGDSLKILEKKVTKLVPSELDVLELKGNDTAVFNNKLVDTVHEWKDNTFYITGLKDKDGVEIYVDPDKTIVFFQISNEFVKTALNGVSFVVFDRTMFIGDGSLGSNAVLDNERNIYFLLPNQNDIYHGVINYFYLDESGSGNLVSNTMDTFNEDDTTTFLFIIHDNTYKYKDGIGVLKKVNENFEEITQDELSSNGIVEVGLYGGSGQIILQGNSDNIFPYAHYVDGIFEIVDFRELKDFPIYEFSIDGIETDQSKFKSDGEITTFEFREVVGGMKQEDINAIYLAVDEKINPAIYDIKQIGTHVENIDTRLQSTEDFIKNLDNNKAFLDYITRKIEERIIDDINISLIAKNGDVIVSNLVYDEEKHSYVLDYDTSLLDGTDYTIELKLS